MQHLAANNSSLRQLDVAGCVMLGQPGCVAIAAGMTQLKRLRLGGCSRMATVSDPCIAALSSLTHLTALDASGCVDVTDSGQVSNTA